VDAGLSGKRADNRPALQQALASATKGDALVVYSLSRLSRSTKDTLALAERLEKSGVDLVSLSEKIDTTTAAGKMVFRMLAVLAEFERDQVSERTKAAMGQMKAQGERIGAIPYGKRLAPNGKSLEDNPGEMDVVRIVKTLRQGGMSLTKIGRELEGRGFSPRGSKPWHPQTVKNIAEA
jgi:DNA invertase Pin-like site-specific DNA recombinase